MECIRSFGYGSSKVTQYDERLYPLPIGDLGTGEAPKPDAPSATLIKPPGSVAATCLLFLLTFSLGAPASRRTPRAAVLLPPLCTQSALLVR